MFNYKRRVLLSFLVCTITLCLLQTVVYINYTKNTMHDFICQVGIIYEECPQKTGSIINKINKYQYEDQDLVYAKGQEALAVYGYGTNSINYFKSLTISSYHYIFLILGLVICLTLLGIYTKRPATKIATIICDLIRNIELSMNTLPIQLETTITNIPVINELNAQIISLVEQLNHQIELLKRAQADRTVFIENISHQIKTPLTCISLDLELLSNVNSPDKIAIYTDSCYTQIDHIEALINRLLKIGKLESGKIHYEFLEHNLLDTINVLCNSLEAKYSGKKVTLSYDPEDSYIISYDIVWLYEALDNIANNCYLYSYDNQGIELELTRYDSYIKIILRDHGIGISTKDLPNIFDRFYRSDQTKNQEGFGIGLNLAKLVIEDHHGSIFAQSDNRSTQFIIHLPLIIS
ncbi:MAG: HAMP domain-containing sensor histidine kinase [bacterium]|nr:HAMP domain-containing sensor histidine kinase [bacterium]